MSTQRTSLLVLLLIPLAVFVLTIQAQQGDEEQQGDQIFGNALEANWTISVNGTSGTFLIDNKTWNIEFFGEFPGQNSFERLLSFFGREADNFIRLDVFLNSFDTRFLVFYYDYKAEILVHEEFEGTTRVGNLIPQPNFVQGYLPSGAIPDYTNPENPPFFEGQDFDLSSPFANVTPEGGTVSYQGLQLQVFPVLNVVISESWSEFWTIGVDVNTCKSYFLQFYLTQSSFIFDLESGEVQTAPLGGAQLVGGDLLVQRDFELADHCQ